MILPQINTKSTLMLFLFAFFLALMTPFLVARAQSTLADPSQVNSADISITVIPEVPAPNENTTINLTSYSTDLNQANITWKVGGKTTLSGLGKKQFMITTGGAGSTTNITIEITTLDGIKITKSVVLSPSDMDLVWQALDSYTPPFYKGRALPSSEGIIKIVAMPIGKTATSTEPLGSKLVYNWKRNFNSVQNLSGYGKSHFIYQNSYLNNTDTIEAVAYSSNPYYSAKKSITLGVNSPKIIFYEKDPLEGIKYNRALSDGFTLTKKEMGIESEPYFISPGDKSSEDLSYIWKINSQSITAPSEKNSLVVRAPEGGEGGVATISLSIENLKKLFQETKSSLSINLPNN